MTSVINKICNGVPSYRVGEESRANPKGLPLLPNIYSSERYQILGDMKGLSPRNLKYMRKFAEAWSEKELVQRTVALIPWRSNLALLDKLDNREIRLWYARKTIENGWSRKDPTPEMTLDPL